MKLMNSLSHFFRDIKIFLKHQWEIIIIGRNKLFAKLGDWKTFEKNNSTIALNIFYTKGKEIFPAYISNHNLIRENQIILLMIPNEETSAWHYIAVKKISALLHKTYRVIRVIFIAWIVFVPFQRKIN